MSRSISRRDALATLAAGTAAAALPSTARGQATANPQPLAPADRAIVYGVLGQYGDLPAMPEALYPSQWQAEDKAQPDRLRADQEPTAVVRVPVEFSGRQYRIAYVDFDGYGSHFWNIHDSAHAQDADRHDRAIKYAMRDTGLARATINADVRRYATDPALFDRKPRHALDVPDVLTAECDNYLAPCEITDSRGTALRWAAEFNREQIGEGKADVWAVVVEIGEAVESLSLTTTDFSGDLGVQKSEVHRPVRVVRPTAEEVDRFARFA